MEDGGMETRKAYRVAFGRATLGKKCQSYF